MVDTPIEDTLIVAAHAQLHEEFAAQTVVTSGHEESRVGFDVSVPAVKQIALQYKRPYMRDDGATFKFDIDEEQRQDLVRFADRLGNSPSVFYALPRVKYHEQLRDTLARVLFVDVTAIDRGTTLVYIPAKEPSEEPDQDLDAYVNGAKVSGNIDSSDVWGWDTFKERLLSCSIGAWAQMDDNRQHCRVPRPPVGATTTIIENEKFQL